MGKPTKYEWSVLEQLLSDFISSENIEVGATEDSLRYVEHVTHQLE